jgi:hypothetical protein
LQLYATHPLEKLMQADTHRRLNPLSFGIDPCQRYHCADDGTRRDLHFVNSLDESLKSTPQVMSAAREKVEGMQPGDVNCQSSSQSALRLRFFREIGEGVS